MKRLLIRTLLLMFVFSILGFSSGPRIFAEEYPSKNIRWIVGGKPGGGVDWYARTIGRFMEKYLPAGVHVIVENRPGAGHAIANSLVYNAKPDGYTIGTPFMPGLYLLQLVRKTNYDMTKISWVAMYNRDPRCISISSSSKFKTLKDLQGADSVRFAIVGPGSEAGVMLSNEALGIRAEYVSGHKNSKEAVLAALRGDVDAVGFTYNSTRKFISKGQLIPVVVLGSEQRLPAIPEVPTMTELGHDQLNKILGNFRVISATPGIPKDRLEYLRNVVWKTLHDKELLAISKKAVRPINPITGEETEKIMQGLMKRVFEYKDFFKQYIK